MGLVDTDPTDPILFRRLQDHFGEDPAQLPVVSQSFAAYELPNLHLAIDEFLVERAESLTVLGVVSVFGCEVPSLPQLCRPKSSIRFDEGPVDYEDVILADGRPTPCVIRGLYLITESDRPIALLVREGGMQRGLHAEVMAPNRDAAQEFLRGLAATTRHGRAFRGHVLSVEATPLGIDVKFHSLPEIARDEIILPEEVLERIERHTLAFSRHAERLHRAGRHLKRGILLHGPPGTGKTLTAMYIAAQMPGRTVILATGGGMGSLETACRLARALSPATIILEDVDLIGTERNEQSIGANALLFELLNQMDGLADDVDLLFVLTTNRPDILEPALSSRPGRIDQAIEVPLPDAECRRRLFDLYGAGLAVDGDVGDLVARTEGASAALIRELLRKAAVLTAVDDADGDCDLVVRREHLEDALTELVVAGGSLTQSLLGSRSATPE